jgi:DNA-directed RNA polymerase specialized sigma24 family protein
MKPEAAGERAAALLALSADQKKRLAAYARILAVNLEDAQEDLLQTAHVRWLKSPVPVRSPEETTNFLAGAMRSRASNLRRHRKLVRAVHGDRSVPMSQEDEDPIELAPDGAASQDDSVFAQQLYDLSASDEEVQAFIMYRTDGVERSAVMREMGWDEQKYEAVRKRKLRMVAQWRIEGKVP